MSDGEIVFNGITLGGDTPYSVTKLEGWEDIAGTTDYSTPRVRGHGDHLGDQFAISRIVTVTGSIVDEDGRNALTLALLAATQIKTSDLSDLTIDLLGRQLRSGARIIRRAVTIEPTYVVGEIPFVLQWKCPDPLRYGDSSSASTGLPTSGGGLPYPLAYPLTYGTAGNPGQVTVRNPGTAEAPVVFTITGSLPLGFEISGAGQRITYPLEVPAGQAVTIDTGTGTVLVEGTSDRRSYLTNSDWMQVPAGGSLTVQFTSLGGIYDPAARLTAATTETYW